MASDLVPKTIRSFLFAPLTAKRQPPCTCSSPNTSQQPGTYPLPHAEAIVALSPEEVRVPLLADLFGLEPDAAPPGKGAFDHLFCPAPQRPAKPFSLGGLEGSFKGFRNTLRQELSSDFA